MTQAKLAQIAGTSVATVSKAFAGSHEISDETRERIFALARIDAEIAICSSTFAKMRVLNVL